MVAIPDVANNCAVSFQSERIASFDFGNSLELEHIKKPRFSPGLDFGTDHSEVELPLCSSTLTFWRQGHNFNPVVSNCLHNIDQLIE
jgi:hypothetical protein